MTPMLTFTDLEPMRSYEDIKKSNGKKPSTKSDKLSEDEFVKSLFPEITIWKK